MPNLLDLLDEDEDEITRRHRYAAGLPEEDNLAGSEGVINEFLGQDAESWPNSPGAPSGSEGIERQASAPEASGVPRFTNRDDATFKGDPNRAASQWNEFIEAKYGKPYAAERTVGTPEHKAGGANSYEYEKIFNKIMAQPQPNMDAAQQLLGEWEGAGQRESASKQELYKTLESVDEPFRQRRENAFVMKAIAKIAGIDEGEVPLEGSSGKTGMATMTKIADQKRAAQRATQSQQASGRADDRLDMAKDTAAKKQPNEMAVRTAVQNVLGKQGIKVEFINNRPVLLRGNSQQELRDGPQIYAKARDEVLRGMGAAPPVQRHPAEMEMESILEQSNASGVEDPRLVGYRHVFNTLIKAGKSKEEARLEAAKAVTGLR